MNTEQELRLDPAALDAARRATGTIPGAAYWDDCARIITAYLAALPPAVAAGGVTEEMVDLAWRRLNGAKYITPDDVRAALTAALAVGDEGIREGEK